MKPFDYSIIRRSGVTSCTNKTRKVKLPISAVAYPNVKVSLLKNCASKVSQPQYGDSGVVSFPKNIDLYLLEVRA